MFPARYHSNLPILMKKDLIQENMAKPLNLIGNNEFECRKGKGFYVSVSPFRTTSSNKTNMNFAWSLKPIFIWVTIVFGIDLDKSKRRSTLRRRFIIGFGISWLFLFTIPVLTSNITLAILGYTDDTSFIAKLNFQIAAISAGFFGILFHLSVFWAAHGKWRPLWKRLQRIQDIIGENTMYSYLRGHAIVGLVLIFTVVLVHTSKITVYLTNLFLNRLLGCRS